MRTAVLSASRPASEDLQDEVLVQAVGLSDPGAQRKKNEDQFVVATVQRRLAVTGTSLGPDVLRWLAGARTGTILLVADGMGGSADGGLASTIAVKSIVEHICNAMPSAGAAAVAQSRLQNRTVPGMRAGLANALEQADVELRRAAGTAPATARGREMGTTVTLAYVLWPELYLAHAGDSRCYLFRRGKLERLTTDHTYAEHYRAAGAPALDTESPWHHMLWNALGGVRNSVLQPQTERVPLEPLDTLLLCSDGLTKHVPDSLISGVLAHEQDLEVGCQQLIGLANHGGGSDNVTVVLARCIPLKAPAPGPARGPEP
jgi:serine/threonine protein phosphatase PrpC